jgi:hypothetical protein
MFRRFLGLRRSIRLLQWETLTLRCCAKALDGEIPDRESEIEQIERKKLS